MHFIDLSTQYQELKQNIDKRIHQVLDHGQYIMGPEVSELEERLAEYVGVKHCISCANGTDALQLALMALEVGKGDAIFCPAFTFFATAEAPAFLGATPIFVDSEEDTFNICPFDLKNKIETICSEGKLRPKAIIAVDLFGLPANYPEITKIANKYDLKLIEDAAQGFGGEANSRKAGSFGDISTTSFFPAKPLGCYGDGGAIFTDSDEYADLLCSYRIHGKGQDKYDNIRVGVNSRLDTIQAAVLLEKLKVFPHELLNRNSIANKYTESISTQFICPQVICPQAPDNFMSSWAQYTLKVKDRESLLNHCKSNDIPTMVYYRTCMHQQSAFKHLSKRYSGSLLTAESLSVKVLSLPMHPYLSEQDVEKVVRVLNMYEHKF